MTTLSIDYETRSEADLKLIGTYEYAFHPTTDVWVMAWAFDDDEPELWRPSWTGLHDGRLNDELVEFIVKGGELRAWNANFERLISNAVMRQRYGFPRAPLPQWFDTAADAAALALPRRLEHAAVALGLPQQKDDAGRRLMLQMTKPRKPTKNDPRVWWDEPEKQVRLGEYCAQDVRVERAVYQRVRLLPESERELYLLDQAVNDRGVLIDVPLVEAAQRIVVRGVAEANAELNDLSCGEIARVTNVADMGAWVRAAGVDVENLRKDTVRDLLAGGEDLPGDVQRVLELRQQAGKSSTAKLTSMLSHASRFDDRARGSLLYHAAGTGRWAGKGIQPQNFTRPDEAIVGKNGANIDELIELIEADEYEELIRRHPPLLIIAALLRSMLIATDGHDLCGGDFSNIEARLVAWFAGQENLVELFATGGKVYETMGAFIFGVTLDEVLAEGKGSYKRQVGKNTILGCGFGMGGPTFCRQALRQTGIVIPEEVGQSAVTGYRTLYSRVPDAWYDVERAAKKAIQNPGKSYRCLRDGNVLFTVRGQFLWCRLPSGRLLAYAKPDIRPRLTPWGEMKDSIAYMGVHPITKQWKRQGAYGGMLFENIVQATARDLMAGAMLRVEKAGYPVVLTVHDEVVAEPREDFGSTEEYVSLMREVPEWARGLPVAVDGWRGKRYTK